MVPSRRRSHRRELCAVPGLPNDPQADKLAVARDPAIVRAMALYRIDRGGWAQREWDDALSGFNDSQRRLAVEVAQDNGWFDRGVFGLVNVGGKSYPEESRLYRLRFPLHHDATIRREAGKHGIDPAWVAAEIRAESVFNPKARSSANAMGLMQVLPGTGAAVAKRIGLPWGAPAVCMPGHQYRARHRLLASDGRQVRADLCRDRRLHAGPAPVARWQSQRPGMDPDFWIETVIYKRPATTSHACSLQRDLRLASQRRRVAVSERLRGRTGAARKRFACPLVQAPPPAMHRPPMTLEFVIRRRGNDEQNR